MDFYFGILCRFFDSKFSVLFSRYFYHVFWETCVPVKKQQLELDMEQQTGSKLRKKYIKTVYYHPAYLTYMQSLSC